MGKTSDSKQCTSEVLPVETIADQVWLATRGKRGGRHCRTSCGGVAFIRLGGRGIRGVHDFVFRLWDPLERLQL
jgi:hypothetical protein